MLHRLALAAAVAVACSPAFAKDPPRPATTFSSVMDEIAKSGDVIAQNRIKVLIYNDDRARAVLELLAEMMGTPNKAKPSITHVILMYDESGGIIQVFEGEKLIFASADKAGFFKALIAEWEKRNV